MDPIVDIHNFPNVPLDETLKRKRRFKKDGERTSNPPSSFKQLKNSETSRRDLKYAVTEVVKAVETARVIEAARVAEVARAAEAARTTEVAKVEVSDEESSHLTKEAEKESAEASAHYNPYKSSKFETFIISDSINLNTSSVIFPITCITNPTNTLESTTPNITTNTNTLETNEPENTTTNEPTPQGTIDSIP